VHLIVFIIGIYHDARSHERQIQDICLCEYFECVNSFLMYVQVLYVQPLFKVENSDYLRVDRDLHNATAPPLFASRRLYEYQSEFPSPVTRNSPSQSDLHTKRGSRTRCILLQKTNLKTVVQTCTARPSIDINMRRNGLFGSREKSGIVLGPEIQNLRSYPKQIIDKNVKTSHNGFRPRHLQFIIVIRQMQLTRRNSNKSPALTSNSSPITYKYGHVIA
jgi:hypothetical protein